MRAYELSIQAREDSLDLWLHIASRNPVAADRQVSRIEKAALRCATFPELGRRPDLGDGYRVLPIDSYLLIYRPIPTGIIIDRILHAARDIDTEFSE